MKFWLNIMRIIQLLFILPVVVLTGCNFRTQTVLLSDPQLVPMLQAIAASDRASLGFAAIPTDALVYLNSRPNTRRDVEMLIFDSPARYDGIYRNIEFRKTVTGYKWLREFEHQPGPMTFTKSGHTTHESIFISFDTDESSGSLPGRLDVSYTGPDSRLALRKDLTLDKVRPILAEWNQKH